MGVIDLTHGRDVPHEKTALIMTPGPMFRIELNRNYLIDTIHNQRPIAYLITKVAHKDNRTCVYTEHLVGRNDSVTGWVYAKDIRNLNKC